MVRKEHPTIELTEEQLTELRKWEDEAYCLAAVKDDGDALQYVKVQTPECVMAAVTQNGDALRYVKVQTPECVMAAVKQNANAYITSCRTSTGARRGRRRSARRAATRSGGERTTELRFCVASITEKRRKPKKPKPGKKGKPVDNEHPGPTRITTLVASLTERPEGVISATLTINADSGVTIRDLFGIDMDAEDTFQIDLSEAVHQTKVEQDAKAATQATLAGAEGDANGGGGKPFDWLDADIPIDDGDSGVMAGGAPMIPKGADKAYKPPAKRARGR